MTSPPPRPVIPTLAELPLTLATPRLRLRLIAETDIEDLWPSTSDPDFPRLMSWRAHADREETRAFIQAATRAHADNTAMTWTIERDGRAIGCIALEGIRWQLLALRVDHAELGYWVQKASWGDGLMTEAASAVLRCAFQTIGLHKVTVSALEQNLASRRVIEKLGFRYVGKSEDDVWRDGHWHAHLRYELTSSQHPDAQAPQRSKRSTLVGV